jgi:hypothetical protein
MAEEEHKTREMNDSKHLAAANPPSIVGRPLVRMFCIRAFVKNFLYGRQVSVSQCVYLREEFCARKIRAREDVSWDGGILHTTNDIHC